MKSPLLIIPAYIDNNDHCKLLAQTIKTIDKTCDDPDVLIVDDGSVEDERSVLFYSETREKFPYVSVLLKGVNEGFSRTVNVGLKMAKQQKRDAVLINADIEFTHIGWLERMSKTDGDIIGAKLIYPNGTIQHGGVFFSALTRSFEHRYTASPANFKDANELVECPVTAALQYIKYPVLEKVGLYDEEFKMGFEDVDFCIRALKQGFRCVYNPEVSAIHHEHAFRGNSSDKVRQWERDSLKRLYTKYQDEDFGRIMKGF